MMLKFEIKINKFSI